MIVSGLAGVQRAKAANQRDANPEGEVTAGNPTPGWVVRRLQGARGRFRTVSLKVLLTAVSAAIATYLLLPSSKTVSGHHVSGDVWLRAAVAFTLSFFPGWLLVRFLNLRAPALWSEFRVNLFRLGVDHPEFLPEPPTQSEYHLTWRAGRDRLQAEREPGCEDRDDNLYTAKYQASYGPTCTAHAGDGEARLEVKDTPFPVLLVTGMCAVGWTAILADEHLYLDRPLSLARVLAVAFGGAYLFNLQMLMRRFFQNDLKSSACVTAFVRTVTVLITAAVLFDVTHREMADAWTEPVSLAAAFILGFFPVAGIVFLRNLAARRLKSVGTLHTNYPLSELDGLNLWYETRLAEEGIEDMRGLVDANIVDVILHTRVPVGRLIDWLDQAHLFLHLPPVWSDAPRSGPTRGRIDGLIVRNVLCRAGIVNASSFLAAFGQYTPVEDQTQIDLASGRRSARAGTGPGRRAQSPCSDPEELARWIERGVAREVGGGNGSGDGLESIRSLDLVRILVNDTALTPVLNWRHCGVAQLEALLATASASTPQDAGSDTPQPPTPIGSARPRGARSAGLTSTKETPVATGDQPSTRRQ